ncbi:hypothetical protein K443DRAFT_674194 [Laccaria amethystina LaAM-08-1]|uniref:B30.2/SPRY domain-containing protein n=1 Tax=Laccaria amethystina LaAM-08-1 TaxID=1095629 RepID=A0A0C9X350_9AGAR|nr:hypothetical protein K443DRAFT_674194 [Laccaria amethystina LaAM-08-1]
MFAEGSSPPPQDTDALPIVSIKAPVNSNGSQPQARKRKRAPATPSSPAPSDPGSNAGGTTTDLLASRADLSSRAILTISRGPVFIPTAEGSEWYKTDAIGVNRIGFRYMPAGINPQGFATPCRTIESNPTTFRVSWEDRSPYLKVTKDGLSIAGSKGFRSARCNAPIREGRWYMEVKVLHGGGEHVADEARREGSHVRLGWGRREAPLNGPVGLDGYSYGYRDKTGDKVNLSRPRPYGRQFGSGDVIGMYISLPPRREANKKDPHDPAHIKRERIPIDLKGQEVFEILEYPQSKEMTALMDYSGKVTSSASVPSSSKKSANGKLPERSGPVTTGKANTVPLRPLPTLSNSRIAFFVNGECQGIAFQDLYDYRQLRQSNTQRKAKEKKRTREGVKEHRENPFDDGTLGYHPFISLFNDASVRLNPGPTFDFPPPPDIEALLDGNAEAGVDTKPSTWRPMCDRYAEFMAEQWALDAQEEEEAKVEAVKQAAIDKAEEEKRIQRNKKRQQAEARKRAKKAAVEPGFNGPFLDDERFLAGFNPNQPSPSPLRHATSAYDAEGSVENEHSPAPTFASYGDFQGNQSGYNSEAHDVEMDQDNLEEPGNIHPAIS